MKNNKERHPLKVSNYLITLLIQAKAKDAVLTLTPTLTVLTLTPYRKLCGLFSLLQNKPGNKITDDVMYGDV